MVIILQYVVVSDQHKAHLCAWVLSCVQLFGTPWTKAHWAALSMGFPRQEYWSGLPFPSTGDLPDLGIELGTPVLAGGFFTLYHLSWHRGIECMTGWQRIQVRNRAEIPVSRWATQTLALLQCSQAWPCRLGGKSSCVFGAWTGWAPRVTDAAPTMFVFHVNIVS